LTDQTQPPSSSELFDVVIVERATRTVVEVTGQRMLRDKGFYNAEKRYDTTLMRIGSDAYYADIVPTGVKKGDVLPQEVF
jgi:hypothetical protein